MVADIVRASRRWGLDPLLVQGAGGNVSWKEGDTLWIKASGTSLAAATPETFLPMSLSSLRSEDPGERARASLIRTQHRPSIETRMHAVIPHRVVVHLHAVDVLAALVRVDWREVLSCVFEAPGITAAAVPYARPGEPLARAIEVATASGAPPDVYLLQSHGIVVAGKDIGEAGSRLAALLAAIHNSGRVIAYPGRRNEAPAACREEHPTLIRDPGLVESVERAWALYPDHVVFLGASPVVVDELGASEARDAFPLTFVRGVGAAIGRNITAAQWAQFECYRAVIARVPASAELRTLDECEIEGLLRWEAEEHRQRLAH